jgi:hypothetical protein
VGPQVDRPRHCAARPSSPSLARHPPELSPGAPCDLLVAVGLPHHRLRRCLLHRKAIGEGPVTPSDSGGALAIGMMSPCG